MKVEQNVSYRSADAAVIKKDGSLETFEPKKIVSAARKSACRVMYTLSPAQEEALVDSVVDKIESMGLAQVQVDMLHRLVEKSLDNIAPQVAESYRNYRNYKESFSKMMKDIYNDVESFTLIGDKENANRDSSFVSTKKALTSGSVYKSMYKETFLTPKERASIDEGDYYVHDMSDRLLGINCFRRDTRFITKDGVKSFYDFSDGDETMVLSHQGIWRKAVVRKYGWQPIQKVTLKQGVPTSKPVEIFCTKDHRWILKDGTETTSLKEGDILWQVPDRTVLDWDELTLGVDSAWRVISIEPEKLGANSEVWCLEVEEDHSFLLEGGIPTGNCCLFRMEKVLKGGFEMANIWYNEPKTLDTAFDVIADVVLSAASQQYGGFTIPQVDKLLSYYAEKSYNLYKKEYEDLGVSEEAADKAAMAKVAKDYEQGFQGWEYKFNTVSSSRGDYPFITVTSGLDTSKFGAMGNKIMYKVHQGGQGKEGFKKPVLFPKYVFLYDESLHGEGKELHDVYKAGLECSQKTMYPDWLSLTGEGYVPSMYKKHKAVVSPMGCRAFLSPYYERGGFEPEDENDAPVFEGRFNSGAISLNLPLIYLKSVVEKVDFTKKLDEELEEIRGIHKRTKAYIGNLYASSNPLAFMQGGFFGGTLEGNQKLKESPRLMEATTFSFGITALDELQVAHNGKTLVGDGEFALETLKHINEKAAEFKDEDHMLYAIYGTPAESLCGKQIAQLRKYVKSHVEELKAAGYTVQKKGDDFVIPGVCDREYVSNSFHCNVREDISPIMKQDLENRFWDYANGGKIQYVRYPLGYNKSATDALVKRAMGMGFYEGVNMALSYCDDCGHEELEMETCPCCGSNNLTKIDRMNGYLAYSRVKGDTRLNAAKMAEIGERVSM